MVLLVLFALCIVAVKPVKSQSPLTMISVRSDGSISPSDAPIQHEGDVYKLTGDINGSLSIEIDNVTIDGAGYKLLGYGKQEKETLTGLTIEGNNVTVKNMEIVGFFDCGVELVGSNGTFICNNITGVAGIWGCALYVSGSNNSISENRMTANNGMGIALMAGRGNVISNNYIADNEVYGIQFYDSTATLRDNILKNNKLGAFNFMESTYTSPVQDIDASNIVDGMPVCYWANQHHKIVPSNAGYVLLINCTDITVQGLSITNNPDNVIDNSNGIYLIDTQDSTINNNVLTVGSGIEVVSSRNYSQNVMITKNNISTGLTVRGSNISVIENSFLTKGIDLGSSSVVAKNSITSCEKGIVLQGSDNSIVQNNISNCKTGIELFESDNNVFYHNNFINNEQHVYEKHYEYTLFPPDEYHCSVNNTWDGGYVTGGNYWSNYTGKDDNGDGIGDTPHIVYENYTDRFPLMALFSIYEKITIDSTPPSITILSPENRTYNTKDLNLNFTLNEPVTWMCYSLNGEDNITVTGNSTLTALSEGSHTLIVFANDIVGNVGASGTITFTVAKEPESFTATVVATASGASVAVVGLGLFFYFKKRNH